MKTMKQIRIYKSQTVILLSVIIGLVIIISVMNPNFIKKGNILAIGQQISVLGIATMAATMLLKSGLFDLSSSGIISLTCVLVAKFITDGMNTAIAVIIGVCASFAMGCLNGTIISKTKTQPLIITLGMAYAYSGIALVLTGGVFLGLKGKFAYLGNGKIIGIPVSIIVLLVVVIITYAVINYTRYGRRLTAIGNNQEVSYLAGVNVDRYIIGNYTICGGIFGLAGLLLLSRLGSVVAGVGAGYELRSIAAAIIGGISITGGKGNVFGAFLGVILMGILANGMNILNINSYYQNIVLGVIIVAAVIISNLDSIRKK
jgi:ribose/xylose/arabinose/galactoside ABC-type transport system permease subunit